MRTNNNFYALEDFYETLRLLGIKKTEIKSVIKAWGDTNGISREESGTELSLGVVLKMKNGKYMYVEGWNDYTGWGCQDGVEKWESETLEGLNIEERIKNNNGYYDHIIWEEKPEDLNNWIKGKAKLPDYLEG